MLGEQGVSCENMENIEDTENMKNIFLVTLNTLLVIQNALFVNQMTQNPLFAAFMATVEKS